MRRAREAVPQTEQAEAPHRKRYLRWYHLLLVLLVLLSFGLRMWGLDARGIWWDESLSLHRAQGDLAYVLSNRITFDGTVTTDQHPPLYFLLLHGVLRLAGESDLALRFPSVFFATLIVPLLYLLGRRLRNVRVGLLAALFGALSPFYLWYAQELRMYTLVTALSVATVYLLWRSLGDQGWRWGVAFGLAVVAAAATHYLFALVLVFEVVLAITLWPRSAQSTRSAASPRRRWLRLVLAIGVPLVLLGVLAVVSWRHIPSLPSNRSYVPLTGIVRDVINSYSLGLSVNPDEVWPLGVLFVIVFILGLVSAWRYPPRSDKIPARPTAARLAILTTLLGYIFVPVLIMWGVSLFTPLYMGSRYVIMSSPAFYLGLGLGLDHLARRWQAVAWFAGAFLVLSMGMSTYRYFHHEEYSVKEDYRAAAEFLPKLECVGDLIVVVGIESMPAFTHYYAGNLPVVGVPPVGADSSQVAEEMGRFAERYERIWLVEGNDEISDPKGRVPKWAEENMLLLTGKVFTGYIHHVDVSRYKTQDAIGAEAPSSTPLGVFGDALALLDYSVAYFGQQGEQHTLTEDDLQRSLAEDPLAGLEPVPSGNTISVALVSRPLAPLADLKTSLRLIDATGTVVAQRDEIPFLYIPTSQWPTGEVVQHQTYLRVPPGLPPGVHTLQLVFYEAETGEPLAFGEEEAGQFHLDLGRVAVGTWNRMGLPSSTVPDAGRRTAMATVYGGTLELLGHVPTSPPAAVRGGGLEIELYWHAREQVARDHDLLIEWENALGELSHVSDADPIGAAYPASQWERGAVVRNVLRLPVPEDLPVGNYTLYLSARDAAAGRRLRVRHGPFPLAGSRLRLFDLDVE